MAAQPQALQEYSSGHSALMFANANPSKKMLSRHRKPAHVLIITDQEAPLAGAVALLRNQLFRVSFASGWHGFYQAQAWRPDMVLLDGDMQQMDAFMMARLLSQSQDTNSIPIIFLVKPGVNGATTEAFAVGAVDCVPKPIYAEELLARISVHLRPVGAAEANNPGAAPDGGSQEDILLRYALDAIQADVGSIHTVRQLAHSVGTHERKLSSIFKSRTGKSAHKFIFDKKMAAARRLLARTGMPVHAIARHVGFPSVCNFTVAFRRHAGITPTTYRNQAKEEMRAGTYTEI
jgi:AraC-like DNA-binding protein